MLGIARVEIVLEAETLEDLLTVEFVVELDVELVWVVLGASGVTVKVREYCVLKGWGLVSVSVNVA
jgi:hypothetical protein